MSDTPAEMPVDPETGLPDPMAILRPLCDKAFASHARPPWRVFTLWTLDPATGHASRPAGVLGTSADNQYYVYWLDSDPHWSARLADSVPAECVDTWADMQNQITWSISEHLPTPESPDLLGAVHMAVDTHLVPPVSTGGGA